MKKKRLNKITKNHKILKMNNSNIITINFNAILEDYIKCFKVILTMFPIILWTFFINYLSLKYQIENIFKLFIFEYVTLLIILLFNVTIFNNYILIINLMFMILFGVIIKREMKQLKEMKKNDDDNDSVNIQKIKFHKKLSSFTLSRSSINLFTSACILAVDFNIFPINFGKSKTYGLSLMDTGIGLFIFSSGIVWKDKLLKENTNYKNILILFKECLILCLLGIIRIILLKLFNLYQDVTEYGRHWNAFLTIGITRFIGNYLAHKFHNNNNDTIVKNQKNYLILIAVIILGLYELILQYGLMEFIFNANTGRETFLKANREGIFSLIGFVSLYLFSIHIGQNAAKTKTKNNNKINEYLSYKQFNKNIKNLFEFSTFLWLIVSIFIIPSIGISRRICNSGYILWILALGTSMLTLFMIYENYIVKKLLKTAKKLSSYNKIIPLIMISVNYNGLTTFLISNILTGIVNKTINTNKSGTIESLCILSIYIFAVCSIVCFLYLRKIRIA